MPTEVRVHQSDRAEGFLLQVEIVISTIEVIGSVLFEEVPNKTFDPFRRDQPIILNVSIQ